MNTIYEKYLVEDKSEDGFIQKVYKFENGRGASVISNTYCYGGNEGLYELAVLDVNGNIDYSTPITNDVIGWLEWSQVMELLGKIKELD